MAPLILHNVPDEECYVGDDGIKRPYAMYFNQYDPTAPTNQQKLANMRPSADKIITQAACDPDAPHRRQAPSASRPVALAHEQPHRREAARTRL